MTKHSESYEPYIEDPGSMYSAAFFAQLTKCRSWQKEVGKNIAQEFQLKSCVDFGTGSGFYLQGMHSIGCSVKGYEFSYIQAKPFIDDSIVNYICYGDVQTPLNALKCDLAMSLEVAEHIRPDKSNILIDNLTGASNQVLFSAANREDKGIGHINVQPTEFWINLFKIRGYVSSPDNVKRVHKCFDECKIGSHYKRCMRNTIMFFIKK